MKKPALTLFLWTVLGMSGAQAQTSFCQLSSPKNQAEYAVQIACREHQLWREPLIDAQGHLVKIGPMEAERDRLADGTPAWQRVLYYWQVGVGIERLFQGKGLPSASDNTVIESLLRAQIVDTPWSSAFISYLMRSVGFADEEFHFTDGHIRYIKPAYLAEENKSSPYAFHLLDPSKTAVKTGDLLCYVRENSRVFGPSDFRAWLAKNAHNSISLKTHCDIVVGVKKDRAYSVGGNVVQSVTMRELQLNNRGILSNQYFEPKRSDSWLVDLLGDEADAMVCNLDNPKNCNMNRHDWVALLRWQNKSAPVTVPAVSNENSTDVRAIDLKTE